MDEEYEYEKNGHMYFKKNKETKKIISWTTAHTAPEYKNLDCKKIKVLVLILDKIPIIKQLVIIKKILRNIEINDKDLIKNAKEKGVIELGFFVPAIAEKIQFDGKKQGLRIIFEEITEDSGIE